MHRISASKLGLAKHCTYWAREDAIAPPRSSKASHFGSALHEAAAMHVQGLAPAWTTVAMLANKYSLDEEAFVDLYAAFESFVNWWSTYEQGLCWYAEVPFQWNLQSQQPELLDRDRGPRPYGDLYTDAVLPGTADLIAVGNGALHVVDLKTGRAHHVEPASDNLQLAHAALCAWMFARAWDPSIVRIHVAIARVGSDAVWVDQADLGELDLDVAERFITDKVTSVPSAKPYSGEHCRDKFCPFLEACPALSRELATFDGASFEITHANAVSAYRKMKVVSSA